MRVGTFVSLRPAAFPVPRTVPGTCKMLRRQAEHRPGQSSRDEETDRWIPLLLGRAHSPASEA